MLTFGNDIVLPFRVPSDSVFPSTPSGLGDLDKAVLALANRNVARFGFLYGGVPWNVATEVSGFSSDILDDLYSATYVIIIAFGYIAWDDRTSDDAKSLLLGPSFSSIISWARQFIMIDEAVIPPQPNLGDAFPVTVSMFQAIVQGFKDRALSAAVASLWTAATAGEGQVAFPTTAF